MGPAFCFSGDQVDLGDELTPRERELRDSWAGQAMAALLSKEHQELPIDDAQLLAVAAYSMAGLMVEERRKRLTPEERAEIEQHLAYIRETGRAGRKP